MLPTLDVVFCSFNALIDVSVGLLKVFQVQIVDQLRKVTSSRLDGLIFPADLFELAILSNEALEVLHPVLLRGLKWGINCYLLILDSKFVDGWMGNQFLILDLEELLFADVFQVQELKGPTQHVRVQLLQQNLSDLGVHVINKCRLVLEFLIFKLTQNCLKFLDTVLEGLLRVRCS